MESIEGLSEPAQAAPPKTAKRSWLRRKGASLLTLLAVAALVAAAVYARWLAPVSAVLVVTHDHRALDLFDITYEMEDGRLSPQRRAAG